MFSRFRHRSAAGPVSAFTLIELLVVIAIIAVLAAILFPIFARAREKARQTLCMSNMKQISLAAQMYVQDYDERFLFRAGWAFSRSGNIPTTNALRWWNQMMPYIKSGGVFTCPSDAAPTPSKDVNGGMTVRRSYIAICPAESLTMAQVDDPVETMIVAEKWSKVTDSWIEPFNGDFTPDVVHPGLMWTAANRHTGLINCAFFDGHAKALRAGDIQTSKDLTGCNEIYHYPFPGAGAPTVTSSTTSGQPNACAAFQYQ